MSGLVVCLTCSQRFPPPPLLLLSAVDLRRCLFVVPLQWVMTHILTAALKDTYWWHTCKFHTVTLYKQQHFPRSQMTDTYQQLIHSLFLRTHCAHQGYPLQTAAALSLPVNMTWNPLIKSNQDTFHPRSLPFLWFNVIFLLVSVNWGAFQDFIEV